MSFATFTPPIAPSPGTQVKPKIKLLKAEFGDGYTQYTPDGLNSIKRSLTLNWETLLPSQAASIVSFLTAQGGYKPFYYTPSDETTPIKWLCEVWDDKRGNGGLRTVNATFEESFNIGT